MINVVSTFQGFLKSLRWFVAILIVLFFAYMTVAVLAQVFGRYLFNYSIGWAAETATFAQIWMIFLGAGLAMQQRLHVGVDILYAVLPRMLQRLVAAAILCAGLWFLWVAANGSLRLIQIGFMQTSPVLKMPMWAPYLALPVGLGYFALEFAIAYIGKIVASEDLPNFDDEAPL